MAVLDDYYSLLKTLKREAPLLYMAISDHRNLRGSPMSFGTMPYLVPLYQTFPDLDGADVISAVQTGKSELFTLLMLYLAGWRGRVCAYVLPTFSVRSRFVRRRIDPLLTEVKAYRDRIPGGAPELAPSSGAGQAAALGSHALKLFGSGTLMFLGSNTPTDFLEFSADALFIDEYDACEPENLIRARDRLLASPHPQMFRLANPTIPGTGIDKIYRRSDQRRWYYRCPCCGEAQPLDWFVNFVRRRDDGSWELRDRARAGQAVLSSTGTMRATQGDARPVCRRCQKPFERYAAWFAWVAEDPAAGRRRGYHMTRLDVLDQSITELFAAWVEAQGSTVDVARFYTSILGLAYEQSGAAITVEDLRNACRGAENDHVGGPEYANDLIVMGVDVGTVLNVTIDAIRLVTVDGEKRIERTCVHVGGYLNFEDLDDLIERFHVGTCVIDAMPETRKAQELRDRHLGGDCDVWLCRFFPVPRVGRERFGLRQEWDVKVVEVDRTQMLDAAFDDLRHKRRVFPSDSFSTFGWSDQMRAPKRVLDEGKGRITWTEGNAADHYRLSDAYALVAHELSQRGGSYVSG